MRILPLVLILPLLATTASQAQKVPSVQDALQIPLTRGLNTEDGKGPRWVDHGLGHMALFELNIPNPYDGGLSNSIGLNLYGTSERIQRFKISTNYLNLAGEKAVDFLSGLIIPYLLHDLGCGDLRAELKKPATLEGRTLKAGAWDLRIHRENFRPPARGIIIEGKLRP